MPRCLSRLYPGLLLLVLGSWAEARQLAGGSPRLPDGVRTELDLPYAGTANPKQRLDLYLPARAATTEPLPVIAYVHGGGWRGGDKRGAGGQLALYASTGDYAAASIGYRLTDEATWPAQIHDCKAAIRWLRAHAATYNLDPNRIGVMGTSAGGHLVAMLGTSGDVAELDGSLGAHGDQSSRVQCVVDWCGPTDFTVLDANEHRTGPLALLLGGPLAERRDASREASPTTYVSKDDPPFLCIHGTHDAVVPFRQSALLDQALEGVGVECVLLRVEGGGHKLPFRNPAVADRARQFFDHHLRERRDGLSDETLDAAAAPATSAATPASQSVRPAD